LHIHYQKEKRGGDKSHTWLSPPQKRLSFFFDCVDYYVESSLEGVFVPAVVFTEGNRIMAVVAASCL